MSQRRVHRGFGLTLAVVSACGGPRSTPAPSSTSGSADLIAPLPPPENDRGVIGGPRDETAFEFEPKPPSDADAPPVLDGLPPIPEHIARTIGPYLEARRVSIAAVNASRRQLLILTRLGEVAQGYRLDRPGAEPTPLTGGHDPVVQLGYLPGSGHELMFRRDRDGDERFQIYGLDATSGAETLMTDGESRHGQFTVSRHGRVAFPSNARRPEDMDIYVTPPGISFDPTPVVARGGQWLAGSWSRDGERVLVRFYEAADRSDMYISTPRTGALDKLELGGATVRDGRFAPDGNAVFVIADAGADVAGLYRVDPATGEVASYTDDIPWNVELLAMSADGAGRVAFSVNEDGASTPYVLDLDTGARRRIDTVPAGVITSLHFLSPTELAITLATATEPASAYTVELDTGRLVRWTESEDQVLDRKPFVEPALVRYPSFDGLDIPAYYYKPPGDGPFPVLLWIHGGPEEQHRPSFDPLLQYFVTELGIAVLAPNIRGSTGYGLRYLRLDDGLRRMDAIADIGALLAWVDRQPELAAQPAGIYGGSYGGFVVLASLIEYGDRLAAGCDLVGISHLVTFLENTAEYRRDLRRAEYGDERDPEVRAFLDRISPLALADRIATPLLVGHGANDPRVPVAEAEQIVAAVRGNGAEVWYVLARDEGHGFRKRRSRDAFYTGMAAFFDRNLRAVPPDDSAADAGVAGDAQKRQ